MRLLSFCRTTKEVDLVSATSLYVLYEPRVNSIVFLVSLWGKANNLAFENSNSQTFEYSKFKSFFGEYSNI